MLHFQPDHMIRTSAEFSYTELGVNNVKINWVSAPVMRLPGYEPLQKAVKHHKPRIVNGMFLLGDGSNRERAVRRAKTCVRDLAIHNVNVAPFFATFTIAPGAEVDRYDGYAVQKYFQAWVRNKVQRNGCEYLAVFEQHKDGAWHIHAFFQPGSLKLVPARSHKTGRLLTDKRSGYQIFNLPAWTAGYSTIVPVDNNELAVGLYISKYLTKRCEKAGAHYYYKSAGIKTPEKVKVPFLYYDEVKEIFGLYKEENGIKTPILAGSRIFSVTSEDYQKLIQCLTKAQYERRIYENNATFEGYPLHWLKYRDLSPWEYSPDNCDGYINSTALQQSFC